MIFASQEFNNALSNASLWIPLSIVGVIIVILLIILIVFLVKRGKNKKINPNENQALFQALGGKDNLVSSELKGSRLKIMIKSNEKIDQNALKEIGIDNTIVMSNQITLILNDKTIKEFENFKLN